MQGKNKKKEKNAIGIWFLFQREMPNLAALEIISGQVIRLKDNKDHRCHYFILAQGYYCNFTYHFNIYLLRRGTDGSIPKPFSQISLSHSLSLLTPIPHIYNLTISLNIKKSFKFVRNCFILKWTETYRHTLHTLRHMHTEICKEAFT